MIPLPRRMIGLFTQQNPKHLQLFPLSQILFAFSTKKHKGLSVWSFFFLFLWYAKMVKAKSLSDEGGPGPGPFSLMRCHNFARSVGIGSDQWHHLFLQYNSISITVDQP